MNNLISVVTVKHTGTRSIVRCIDAEGFGLFQKLLAQTKHQRYNKSREGIIRLETDTHIFYHLDEVRRLGNTDKLFDDKKMNVVFGHITDPCLNVIRELSYKTKLIIPTRDPLLTLISTVEHYNKKKEIPKIVPEYKNFSFRVGDQLKQWKNWADFAVKLNHFNLPIDLDKPRFTYNNVDFSKLDHIAERRISPMKWAYNNNDIEFIKDEMGDIYTALTDLKDILRPPLEEIGYSDLLWWDN